jgi:hypothetical protein
MGHRLVIQGNCLVEGASRCAAFIVPPPCGVCRVAPLLLQRSVGGDLERLCEALYRVVNPLSGSRRGEEGGGVSPEGGVPEFVCLAVRVQVEVVGASLVRGVGIPFCGRHCAYEGVV